MELEPPVAVTKDEITFDVSELEPVLQAPPMDLEPWPPCYVELQDGSEMLIREAKKEEVRKLLKMVKDQFLEEDDPEKVKDFYDIVGARVYAELLGWYRKRLKDPYILVGLRDGEIIAFANGRLWDEDINISLHTMAFKRGLRAGATMYYAKCAYCFDVLEQEEFRSTFESYYGFKRWGIGMAQPSYPFPEYQHELGGSRVYYITRKYWESRVKDYVKDLTGAEFVRPVPDELMEENEDPVPPSD